MKAAATTDPQTASGPVSCTDDGRQHELARLEAISTLAKGISHEINTPIQFINDNLLYLNSIFSSSQNKPTPQTESGLPYEDVVMAVQESLDGIKQIQDIVCVMTHFSATSDGEFEQVDLNTLIERVVTICRGRNRDIIPITLQLLDPPSKVLCRESQIQHVMTNLISNAIDAIELSENTDCKIRIESEILEHFIQVSISDQGCGIPDALKEKVFHPFFTTKPPGQGTGNGLSLAKEIIMTGHGGDIGLGEKPGFATTIYIRLPLNPKRLSNFEKEL